MRRRQSAIGILCAIACLASGSIAQGGIFGHKHHHDHRFSDWLALLSSEDRAKLKRAKADALNDPIVSAAKQRRDEAEVEYRDLLHRKMIQIDPTVQPFVEQISELKTHTDL